MIAPKRRLTNYALHGREEWFKRIFRDQIAEAAGILEVVLSGIVLAALLIIRKYFFVPSFGHKMPGGKIAPDMEQKAAETPEAKAGDMAE